MSAKSNQCVLVDPSVSERLVIRECPMPAAGANQAIVKVAAISLNRGEVRMSGNAPAGHRPGWDFAGVIEQAAADGSGPKSGARVVGMLASGAWARFVAAPVNGIAELPGNVEFAEASTLPVAGLTALHSLYHGGFLLGKSVLVTGATGGTGDFACQLATLGGAHVVATVRSPDREAFVRSLGVRQVVVGEDPSPAAKFGPYALIIDSVAGPHFGKVFAMLAHGGTCVMFGATGGEATFNASKFYPTGAAKLYGLILFDELLREPASIGLKILGELVSAGKIKPHIEVRDSWRNIAAVSRQLMDRKFIGKAVLAVD